MDPSMGRMHYQRLAIVLAVSSVLMFMSTYAAVARTDHILPNVNRMYMAGLMVTPMPLLMLSVMGMMYPNRPLNWIIGATAVVAGLLFFLAIRQQALVGDEQFLESMIPHHSSAILMCEQASLHDEEIRALCVQIIESQESEITQMQAIRERLGSSSR